MIRVVATSLPPAAWELTSGRTEQDKELSKANFGLFFVCNMLDALFATHHSKRCKAHRK